MRETDKKEFVKCFLCVFYMRSWGLIYKDGPRGITLPVVFPIRGGF